MGWRSVRSKCSSQKSSQSNKRKLCLPILSRPGNIRASSRSAGGSSAIPIPPISRASNIAAGRSISAPSPASKPSAPTRRPSIKRIATRKKEKDMWKPGDTAVLRGIYNQHVWIAQSAVVVKNDGDEVALAMLPGAECVMPEGYINGKHGVRGKWDRWEDYAKDHRDMQKFAWHTNRLLVLMEPEKYYATIYFWENASNQFLCYYVNFQLPFRRSEIGFDTLDLELDIVIEPTYEWHWKDEDDFQRGIKCGILRQEWIQAI